MKMLSLLLIFPLHYLLYLSSSLFTISSICHLPSSLSPLFVIFFLFHLLYFLLTLNAVWSSASSKKKVVTGNARPGILIRAQPTEVSSRESG